MLARNGSAVSVIDVGEAEALQRTAHERVLHSPDPATHKVRFDAAATGP